MKPFDSSFEVRFHNILLATDFSPSSETALLFSLSLAKRYQARVFLAHVVNPPALKLSGDALQRAVNDAWREAHTIMTDQLIAGRLEGIENHVVVVPGDTWEELSKMIDKFKIDLLVVGTRGRTGVMKVLLGSTAESIFRQAPCPVLTVGPKIGRGPLEHGPKRILYSTGFLPQSLHAGNYALSLAQQQRGALAMLTVIREAPDSPQKRKELEKEAYVKLKSLVPPDAKLEAPPDLSVAFGSPADAILKLSDEWKPDMIVLGVRRPEKDARRITRATAYNVISNAKCPVLTVKRAEDS
jgi:nucleotide-binding universal stress UspA family protein